MLIRKGHDGRLVVLSTLLCILIYAIVYGSGGTKTPYPHLFYLPIVLSAFYGGRLVTLYTTLLSSMMMSIWFMPMNVETATLQSNFGWIFRSLMYFMVATTIHLTSNHQRNHFNKLLEKKKQLHLFSQTAFDAILHLAETRDPETTGNHLNRIRGFAEILLKDLKISDEEKQCIVQSIALHDIGKVAIPDAILLKPGKFTLDEFEVMKTHVQIGGDILKEIEISITREEENLKLYLKTAMDIIYYHHERIDGSGYPQGVKLEQIPLSARVAAICDVYDALASARPYKEPYPHSKCVDIIKSDSGKHFDPHLVELFLKYESEFEKITFEY